MAVTLTHPAIGTIKGKPSIEGVTQYLGLQYATLKDKFAPAQLRQYDQNGADASKLGPQVLCFPPGPDVEQTLLQHTLDYDRSEHYISETEGLNLNVTVPAETTTSANLPVLTFIHGGGYNIGSATFPQYDMSRLVKLSVKLGTPVIAVSINYRLNAPGFLTSEELRSAGYETNNALRDQQTALQWIHKYIGGFSGDPSNITLMGESAGGVSVAYHLHSNRPLFKRAILMSGTQLLMPPVPLAVAEAAYTKATKALGLDSLTPEERVRALISIDGKGLVTKCMQAGIPFVPVHDNQLIDFTPTFDNVLAGSLAIPGRDWCEATLIGDCQFDGNIMAMRIQSRKTNIGESFCSSITESLGTNLGMKFLSAYKLTPDLPDDEAFFHILEVCNDLMFHLPTLALAETISQKSPVYMYRFNEPNPWDGPWKGQSTHIQDLTWLLQNFNEFLEEPQRKQAEEFARDVVAFVNGKECWEKWTSRKKVAKLIGPEGKSGLGLDLAPHNGRRSIVCDLVKEMGANGVDKLNEALTAFLRGPA